MENVMTKGFCELNENEMMGVDGGGCPWYYYACPGAVAAYYMGQSLGAIISIPYKIQEERANTQSNFNIKAYGLQGY